MDGDRGFGQQGYGIVAERMDRLTGVAGSRTLPLHCQSHAPNDLECGPHMRLYLDTSAINAIADEDSGVRPRVISLITSIHRPFIGIFNVAELASTACSARRRELLSTAGLLSVGFEPLARPGDILLRAVEAFDKGIRCINFSIPKDDRGAYIALRDPAAIDEAARTDAYRWKTDEEAWFAQMHQTAQNKAKAMLGTPARSVTLGRFVDRLSSPALLTEVMSSLLAASPIPSRLTGRELEILRQLEPWRFYLSAMGVTIYDHLVRPRKSKNAGSIDVQQAVYLAAVDAFVTNDRAQRRITRIAGRFGHVRRQVWSYPYLRRTLGL